MTAMPHTPVLRRDRHIEMLPDALIALGEGSREVFAGAAYARVAALLDGTRTPSGVVAALTGEVPAPVAWYVLQDLAAKRLLVEPAPGLGPTEAGWWDAAGLPAAEVRGRLDRAAVEVLTLGPGVGPLSALLAESGLRAGSNGLRVLLVSDYLDPRIEAANAEALAAGLPLLLAQPVGAILWLGPLIVPGETGCWTCLAERLRRNRQLEDFVLRQRKRTEPLPKSRAALTSTEAQAAAMMVSSLTQYAAGGTPSCQGHILTTNTVTGRTARHAVPRRPQCPACGDPARYRPDGPIRIGSVPAIGGSGHRSVAAAATLSRLQPVISPLTGVVTALENYVGHVENLIYSYTASHNFVMGQDSVLWIQEGLRTRTGGKGVTDVQARMSAVGEAIERYCGVARGDEPARRGTLAEIGAQAVDPRRCLHYSDAQYDSRSAWNADCTSIFHRVPNRFDETLAIDWSPCWSLTHDAPRYLPAAFCWYGHPDSREHYFCAGDTNGCAAGATPEEAMLQALFELVERDAVAIWWYNRLHRPALDLTSFDNPFLRRISFYHEGLGRDVWVLDLTHDLSIPVFAAVSRRRVAGAEDIVFGFGAHLDPNEALMRAVTEMNQFLPAVLKRDAEGNTLYAWPEDDAIRFWKNESLESQPWLGPSRDAPRQCRDFAVVPLDDIGGMLRHVVALCRDRGLEVIAQNQTRPDIDLHVFRVVVPGLRHFWRRFGPGRLYDVPVAMGWREAAIEEAELNPIPVFI